MPALLADAHTSVGPTWCAFQVHRSCLHSKQLFQVWLARCNELLQLTWLDDAIAELARWLACHDCWHRPAPVGHGD